MLMNIPLAVLFFIFHQLGYVKLTCYTGLALLVTFITTVVISGGVTNEEYAQTIRRRRELEEKKRQEKEKNKQ